jgi:poly-beta-1,6-N-acetyl-D-glucosamine synthase
MKTLSCDSHPHVPVTTAKSILRWTLLVFIAALLLVCPILYAHQYPYLTTVERLVPPITFTVLLLAWMLGRPLAILVAPVMLRAPVFDRGASVVIPCANAAAEIEEVVASVLAQRSRPLEILLVENNSTDDTWAVLQRLEREHPEVRALRVQTKRGEYAASVAVNQGIAEATHDFVIRMDDDTIMAPNFLERALTGIAANNSVSATAVNLRVRNPSASLWTRFQSIEYMLSMELDRRFLSFFNSILICSGGLSVFRRDAVIEAGGFCSLPRWVSEDMDITLKAHRYGTVSMAPDAVGYTEVPVTLRRLMRQRYIWAISGTIASYLHREGIARPGYWYEGTVGFLGLPVRALGAIRDLFGFLFPLYLLLLIQTSGWWVLPVLAAWMVVQILQIFILRGALEETQGVRWWGLMALFPILYAPILLAIRCVGTWAGVVQIWTLRHKELEHVGLNAAPEQLVFHHDHGSAWEWGGVVVAGPSRRAWNA